MLPVAARSPAEIIRFAPRSAAPAAGLKPRCHIPSPDEIRAHGAGLVLRRALWSLVELACVGAFLAAVLIWSAIGAGA